MANVVSRPKPAAKWFAGKKLTYRHSSIEDGMKIDTYCPSTCQSCEHKTRCTTAKERRVRRWEHGGVLDTMQNRLDRNPGKMKQRRYTVEHVFGTLKFWMGSARFLMMTLKRVTTEMSLHVRSMLIRFVDNLKKHVKYFLVSLRCFSKISGHFIDLSRLTTHAARA
jgi:hypothetical protein